MANRDAPLILTEYVPSPPVTLTVSERDILRKLVPGLTVQPVAGSTDTYTLTSGSVVGVARVGDLTIELRPKVGVAAVLFLVSYALQPRAWRSEQATVARDTNLAEAIVPLFARTAQQALRPGLLQGYMRREDVLSTVRGRVRFADQFRIHTGLPLPVEVVYDDFTADILENQLLRTAVDTLGRLHLRDPGSRTELARLRLHLNGISSIVTDREAPEPHWTRLNERYRPAVSLARLIITTAGLEAQAGGQDASVFLIDMNAVFERFIRVALRERLGLNLRAFPPAARGHATHLDAERQIPLEPDLSWWDGSECLFVGDCKYKRTNGGVPNADVYQLLAYVTAFRLTEGILIYAAGEEIPQDIMIPHAGKRLQFRTIDITRPPAEILDQISNLATEVRWMAAQSSAHPIPEIAS